MAWFKTLFKGSDDEDREVKVREKNSDTAIRIADRYTPTESGKHVHESFKLDTASGEYKEYRGGENSSDRSYNKNEVNNPSDEEVDKK